MHFSNVPIHTLVETCVLANLAHITPRMGPCVQCAQSQKYQGGGRALSLAVYLNLNAPYFSLLMLMATSQNWQVREKDSSWGEQAIHENMCSQQETQRVSVVEMNINQQATFQNIRLALNQRQGLARRFSTTKRGGAGVQLLVLLKGQLHCFQLPNTFLGTMHECWLS